MKIERLEYLNKDIPLLKKDVAMRLLFMFLFLATFIWQFVLLVLNYMRGTLTSIRTILSVILLVSALMFTIISLIYAFRSFNIIQKVTVHGSSIKNITVISNIKKRSFLRIYFVITELISIAMLVVLACTTTYSILQYIYFTTFSYYLPILLFITIAGFNSVYHIKQEISTIQNVREYNSLF